MSAPTRPALRYHGGKWRIAPWVIENLPPHVCYVEPFGGAMSVLLRKRRSRAEVYNDLHAELVTFFRVLREQPEALIESLKLTPYARSEFFAAYEPAEDDLETARRIYVRAWQGMGSSLRPGRTGWRFDRKCTRKSSLASQWCSHGHLLEIAARLQGVLIENRPGLDVIGIYDAPATLFYVDPPYVHTTRSRTTDYQHELDVDGHRALAAGLAAIDGMAIVSGYPSELYDELYAGWRQMRRSARCHNGSESTEVLWISPNADRHMRQGRLFSALDEVAE